MSPDEIEQTFAQFRYERDDRNPPDNLPRSPADELKPIRERYSN